jgi:AsmA-like C-terminal region/AsmA family
VQTTLLGLAIAFIIALVAALVGPYFIDWNQFRPQFEAEASQVIGAPVRVFGALDARLLPAPSLRLRSVSVGGVNDLGKVRADKLDVEFSLSALMRGEWRANQLTISGMALDLGLDPKGRIDWPASSGKFNLGSLSIDRLNLTGRVALHDAASRSTLELRDIVFSGDVRSLAGSVRGDGNVMVSGIHYPFRISSGQTADSGGTRVHLSVDPGERALSIDLEGLLSFAERVPHFDGAVAVVVPPLPKPKSGAPTPWRLQAKVKADPATAHLDQIEASYGSEDRALKFVGLGDVRFGIAPLMTVSFSARQLDADKLFVEDKDGAKDTASAPARWLPGSRTLTAALPVPPIPARIELATEQIMLGGRPVQNLTAGFHGDGAGWTIDRMDFRAPGATHVVFSGASVWADSLSGALDIESSDPDVLVAWLQGHSDITYRNQKLLRLRGNVHIGSDRTAIEALKAEIDGGAVEGRLALLHPATGGSRFEATLKGERLDLDAAAAVARSIAGPQGDWPDEAQVSLELGRAISSGHELSPFAAKFGYSPKTLSFDQLKFGQPSGVAMEGSGSFDRSEATGKLALAASAASLGQISAWLSPFAPALTARLDAIGTPPGPARLKLGLDIAKADESRDRANVRANLDIDAPQLKGAATLTAQPKSASLRGFDFNDISRSEIGIEAKLSADRAGALLALLGLDHAIAAGDGPARIESTVNGVWGAPLRLNARMWGSGIDAELQGTAEPSAADPKASVNLKVRSVNFAPLLGLKPQDTSAQNVRLFGHVSLAGNKLTFDDLDSVTSTSRLRGHLAVTLDAEKQVEGEVGLDAIELAPVFALAVGAAGRDTQEPLGAGLLKGWRGRVAFQALRGVLPGGGELRPIGGTLKSDGQSVAFEALKGGIGGGEVTASVDARQGASGTAVNARVEFANVDGSALRYRGLKMPAGHASLQMTLATQGRSVSALAGAVSGSGTVTLQSVGIAGLDARAFDVAIRASDNGQATDDAKLRQMVEPILSAGSLPIAAAQIPFTIRDGRLRVDATTLDAEGARAILSGGYDTAADQVDIRASLASTTIGSPSNRPEIHLFVTGSPDTLSRNVDVAALSSWLAVRAIDRETRRLDSLERGEPSAPQPAAIPPPTAAPPPPPAEPNAGVPDAALGAVLSPAPDPRGPQLKPKAAAPPPLEAPVTPGPATPAVTQQLAPLPSPIEVKPPPGPPALKPKPRPPLMLLPPGSP